MSYIQNSAFQEPNIQVLFKQVTKYTKKNSFYSPVITKPSQFQQYHSYRLHIHLKVLKVGLANWTCHA